MTKDNFAKSLKAFTNRRPFRSFEIELTNGRRFRVEHPEAIVTRGGAGTAMFIDAAENFHLFDHEGVAQLTDEVEARPEVVSS